MSTKIKPTDDKKVVSWKLRLIFKGCTSLTLYEAGKMIEEGLSMPTIAKYLRTTLSKFLEYAPIIHDQYNLNKYSAFHEKKDKMETIIESFSGPYFKDEDEMLVGFNSEGLMDSLEGWEKHVLKQMIIIDSNEDKYHRKMLRVQEGVSEISNDRQALFAKLQESGLKGQKVFFKCFEEFEENFESYLSKTIGEISFVPENKEGVLNEEGESDLSCDRKISDRDTSHERKNRFPSFRYKLLPCRFKRWTHMDSRAPIRSKRKRLAFLKHYNQRHV